MLFTPMIMTESYIEKISMKIVRLICFFIVTNLAADNFVDGLEHYTAGKFTEAIFFFSKACEEKDGLACGMAGRMYETGEGVKKDDSKAKYFYKKACEYDLSTGCKYYDELNESKF